MNDNYVPGNNPWKKRKLRSIGFQTNNKHGEIYKDLLRSRVEQCLDQNIALKHDVDRLVELLQAKFPEYRRKRINVLRLAVENVLFRLREDSAGRNDSKESESTDNKESESTNDSDISDDSDCYITYEDKNLVNKSLSNLYMKGQQKKSENDASSPILPSLQPKAPVDEACKLSEESNKSSSDGSSENEVIAIKKKVLGLNKPLRESSDDIEDRRKQKEENLPNKLVTATSQNSTIPTNVSPVKYFPKIASNENNNATNQKKFEVKIKKKEWVNKNDAVTKMKKQGDVAQTPSVTFNDLGGIDTTLQEVCKLLVHMKHPEIYQQLGLTPPRGFLLHGPPGCGKTLLAHAIAGELCLPFIKTAATELVSGVSGESEEKIRDLFEKAVVTAPCVLFIDEIDAITPKRETAQKEMERRIVAQLLTCLDDLSAKDTAIQVLVIGATNRPDSLDPALRRAGRFDREIVLGIPDEASRKRILKVLCKDLNLDQSFDFDHLSHATPGFVGADLMSLTREAALCAINRVFSDLEKGRFSEGDKLQKMLSWLQDQAPLNEDQLEKLHLEMQDFEAALKLVQPSSLREGFATVPNVTWNDVGALAAIREELQLAIMAPVKHREKFESLGLSTSSGILLHGPPGCGKTLLAKAIANESGINFISVKGPELLNMYVGESERAVRQCFQRARSSAPCVIFFDELDALCPKRNDSSESGASARVVNQLLTEMDGLEVRKQVFVLAATNRLDMIDPAMLRPGRLDKTLYVGLPGTEDRTDILRKLTRDGTRPVLSNNVYLHTLAKDRRVDGFTGADLAALVREASVQALKESMGNGIKEPLVVCWRHFQTAFQKVHASVSTRDRLRYEKMDLAKASADCTVK